MTLDALYSLFHIRGAQEKFVEKKNRYGRKKGGKKEKGGQVENKEEKMEMCF